MARDQRSILDRDIIARATPLQQHVTIAGRDQHASAQHGVAVGRLLHLDLAQSIEPARERLGEFLRHVLHDDDAGQSTGNASSTSRNDSVPPVEAPMQITVSVVRAIAWPGTGGGMHDIGGQFRVVARAVRSALGWPGTLHPRLGGGLHGIADADSGFLQELRRVPMRGFRMTSTAPASSACINVCGPMFGQ